MVIAPPSNFCDDRGMRLFTRAHRRFQYREMISAFGIVLVASLWMGCARSEPKNPAEVPSAQTKTNAQRKQYDSSFGRMYVRLVFMAEPDRTQLDLANRRSFIGLLTTLNATSGTFDSSYTLRVGNVEWTNVTMPSGKILLTGHPSSNLTGKAHLVRITVPERESGAYVNLKVQDVVRLDGTPDMPFDVEAVFVDFFEPYLAAAGKREDLSQQLARVSDSIKFDSVVDGNGPPSAEDRPVLIHDKKDLRTEVISAEPARKSQSIEDHRYWATWIPATKALRMVVWMSRIDTWDRMIPNPRAGVFGCEAPPGADCAPMVQPDKILKMRKFRAEVAVVGTYSHATRRTQVEEIPAEVHEQF